MITGGFDTVLFRGVYILQKVIYYPTLKGLSKKYHFSKKKVYELKVPIRFFAPYNFFTFTNEFSY